MAYTPVKWNAEAYYSKRGIYQLESELFEAKVFDSSYSRTERMKPILKQWILELEREMGKRTLNNGRKG
jgi:hypothetical protein